MNVNMISLGCSKNLVDAEIMTGTLLKEGFQIVGEKEDADVIIVNTCAFIADAQSEAIEAIFDAAQYKKGKLKKLIVTGCLSQRYKEEVLTLMPEVDAICGIDEIDKIAQIIKSDNKNFVGEGCGLYPEEAERVISTPPYMAYIKIAEGCDNHCTYCIIPKIRGKFRSRKIENILYEAKSLVSKGVREIIIVAQDTTMYGEDIYGERKLCWLLEEMEKIEDLKWIRVLYTYPERISDELLDIYAKSKKIAPYFDIPIQHISDSVLKRMGRKTNEKEIRALIEKIKSKIPNAIIRTTLICGFPGESEEDFEKLYSFVKETKFDRLGVFPYSREEGTAADELSGHIDDEIKKERADAIMKLQMEISQDNLKKYVGKEIEVIAEQIYDGTVIGRSIYDAPDIDGNVFFTGGGEEILGEFVSVKITESKEYDLLGVLAE